MPEGPLLRRAASASVALTALLAVITTSASASAATITTDAACYPAGAPLIVTGQGFTPGAAVSLAPQWLSAAPVADPAGAFVIRAAAPVPPASGPGVSTMTLTAGDGATVASTTVQIAASAARHRPRVPRRPQTVVRWRVSGLPPGAHIYAHYVHRGRQKRRVSFGSMPAGCGVLDKRLAMIPVAQPAPGRWRIQIDARRRYSPRTTPKLVEQGTVTRRIAG